MVLLLAIFARQQIAAFYNLSSASFVSGFVAPHLFVMADEQINMSIYFIIIKIVNHPHPLYNIRQSIIMAQVQDEEALLLLLKVPKKKYIKHLIEYAACLDLNHNCPPPHFTTPLIQSFQADLELSTEQAHRLLLALSNLVSIALSSGFNLEDPSPFSTEFDPQLKQILIQTLSSLQSEIEESHINMLRMGNKLLDINWKLDLQIANQKGKCNIPNVCLQIESVNQTNAELDVHKIQMKGEQFMAFFGNCKKMRESLLQLVGNKQE